MKVQINRLERMTLKQFAEQHGLTLIVDEVCVDGEVKFRCYFDDIEQDVPAHLQAWLYGTGSTIVSAANNYAALISGKEMTSDEDDFVVPILSPNVKIEDLMQELS